MNKKRRFPGIGRVALLLVFIIVTLIGLALDYHGIWDYMPTEQDTPSIVIGLALALIGLIGSLLTYNNLRNYLITHIHEL